MAGGCMKEAGYVYTIINHGGGGGILPYTVGWSLISFTKVQIQSNTLLTPMFLKKVRLYLNV